jgi:DNA-directed RNA polymerase subunit RPC12/RpoP
MRTKNVTASGSVNGTQWQIEQACPQCGAPVTLAETDRLLACPFCRVRLYLAPERYFRYLIPPASGGEGELFYIPYWRLRGSSFTVSAPGVTNRFVDTSALAADIPDLPLTLGLRPQVLKLRFVSPATEGRFIPADRTAEQALPGLGKTPGGVFCRIFIGEAVSMIHAPLFLRGNTLYDAVLGRAVSTTDQERLRASSSAPPGQVRFIPTLCPDCGWDMEGERDSLVLLCRNCNSVWSCPDRNFEKVAFAVMIPPPESEEIALCLPFWRMKPRFEGIDLASWADLIRTANLPKAVTPASEAAPLYFWSPAFKINPTLYARWSRQMTIFRPLGNETDHLPAGSIHPVTLPLDEAAEGIIINLAQMITDRRKLYPKLAGLRVTLEEARLELHPFLQSHNELLHHTLRTSLDRTALAYGIGL